MGSHRPQSGPSRPLRSCDACTSVRLSSAFGRGWLWFTGAKVQDSHKWVFWFCPEPAGGPWQSGSLRSPSLCALLWDVTLTNRGCRAVSSEGAPGARKALCVML